MKTPDEQRPAGASSPIIRVDEVGTALFVITAVLAAALFTNPVKVVAVVVCVALFTIGVFTFLLSFWTAVQRSRTDNISVTQLYFLSGEATPRAVKRVMNGALVVQSVVALATAIARNRTDGRTGSTIRAMFGLGLNGLWCARHGTFAPRPGPESDDPPESDAADVPPSDDEMEQNSRHG